MGFHPLNLALRFILELAALAGYMYWGWTQFEGPLRFVVALLLTGAAAVAWAVFNVPGDRSRSGQAPVPVPGWLRLLIELVILGGGVLMFILSGLPWIGWLLLALIALHYILSTDRIAWLLAN